MSRISIHASRAHAWILERSRGRLLRRMGGHRVLLLQTMAGVPAVRNGAPSDPFWLRNLRSDPDVRVRLVVLQMDESPTSVLYGS